MKNERLPAKRMCLKALPVFLVLSGIFSCSPEIDVYTSMPDGRKLKSIQVVYHDTYGDMPRYDGKYYSSVKFDRRGRIVDLKRGTVRENTDDRDRGVLSPLFNYSAANIAWYLDYGFYADNLLFLAHPGHAWPGIMTEQYNLPFKQNVTTVKDPATNNPLEISVADYTAAVNIKESFQYSTDERLTGWSRSLDMPGKDGEIKSFVTTKTFEYNSTGQVTSVRNGLENMQVLYNAGGLVEEVILERNGTMRLRHEYLYDEQGLRIQSVCYNSANEQEYALTYQYAFY